MLIVLGSPEPNGEEEETGVQWSMNLHVCVTGVNKAQDIRVINKCISFPELL